MLNLDKNKKYLLACSYGPDSMALFHMLLNEGYYFEVAHVNYHFREESNLEENQLRQFCKNNNVNIHVYDNQEKVRSNLEAKARDIRYSFFKDAIRDNQLDALLVAHNQDDHIETYLMQKMDGICTKYYGIKEISTLNDIQIIRPLLSYTKCSLLNYCQENNIPYMIDKSNSDTRYKRNNIRINIVNKYTQKERDNILEKINKENSHISSILSSLDKAKLHDISYLKTLNDEEFKYAIHLLGEEAEAYSFSNKNIQEIHKIIQSNKAHITLKYRNFYLIKEYDELSFLKEIKDVSYSYVLKSPVVLDTPYFYLDFRGDTSNRNVKEDDYPLTICRADPKMKIQIKDYEVSVRRLFIDWKMPLSYRRRWPVILDKNLHPIYIPRYRKGYRISSRLNFYVK